MLILSQFVGAAEQMQDAVLVNPYSPDDLARAIRVALDMPLEERKVRHEKLIVSVREENVQRWTENFVGDLAAIEDVS